MTESLVGVFRFAGLQGFDFCLAGALRPSERRLRKKEKGPKEEAGGIWGVGMGGVFGFYGAFLCR